MAADGLRRHATSRRGEPAETCLPGVSAGWLRRVLADLEWLGYVVVFWDPAGEPAAVQPTEKGRRCPLPL